MSKRSAKEDISRLRKKIKKLQEEDRKRQRIIIYSDSSSDDENTGGNEDQPPVASSDPQDQPASPSEPLPVANEKESTVPADSPEIELDPDLLSALGESTSDAPVFGHKIIDNLAKLWTPLLIKGMPKENKEKILKEHAYLIPENCKMLQAPKLNAEISAAVPDMVRNRDKGLMSTQQQLGAGITAVNRSMDILLHGDDKIQAIKHLSNACRILSDLHAASTQSRIKLITPSLDKSFLHITQDSERDDMLFGNKLSEKIKAAKAIEKQGLQIKKAPPSTKPSTSASSQPTGNRSTQQGNWQAPPRYPSNRGGTGRVQAAAAAPDDPPAVLGTTGETIEPEQTSCIDAVGAQSASPAAGEPYAGCRETLRLAFLQRGYPPESMSLLLASISDNTAKQYNTSYKLWWQFGDAKNINMFKPSKMSVLSFLSKLFNDGCSYGSLNSHRSALSLLIGDNIGSDECIKRLLKGAYNLKPSSPKYSHIWDPRLVLNYIAGWYPNTDLDLERITLKLVTLLAICTAHRVQTLSLIKLKNIFMSEQGARIDITDIIKTSGPGREQPLLILPYFKDDISICPASVLEEYISVTRNKRTDSTGPLLLTFKRPHRPATSQTISRWIKSALSASGVDVSVFSAHSTRHAATSAARSAGISIDAIRKAAGWQPNSDTFARFYNRPIIESESFARSVCHL